MNQRIQIFDTTLRDGEQSPGCSMTVPEKMKMAAKLIELGVDIMEAGFPIASHVDFEAVESISRVFGDAGVPLAALARSTANDVERAGEALRHAKRSRIHTFIATSDIHLQYKLKKSREQVLEEAVKAVELARKYTDDVEFSAEDASRTDPAYLEQISRAVVAAGAGTVNLPDTVGFSIPTEYAAFIRKVVQAIGSQAIVSVHCHDDLGLAVANSLAAVEAGARQIECTMNGIGERAGNCSLEEIVMIFKTRQSVLPYETGINTEHLFSASQLLTSIITLGPQPNKAIVGDNAFAHEAGIHQDGYLKNKSTYEIIDPRSVGVPEGKLVLGKHSGRHALADRCRELGFVDFNKEEIDGLYQGFTALADRVKGVRNDQILALCKEIVARRGPATA
ncbi:MAG: 2-isopropylmalate synthase [Acidobacteriota bacterium]